MLAVVGSTAASTAAFAGPEKIKFPNDYLKGVLYQTVDRPDEVLGLTEALLRRYTRIVHAQAGTIEETARRLDLDRRTVKARLDK